MNKVKNNSIKTLPTIENDGRFLGQKNDPSVLTNYEITNDLHDIKNKGFDIYSSPSKRAMETAELLGLEIKSYEHNLQEFNYGKAEESTLNNLLKIIRVFSSLLITMKTLLFLKERVIPMFLVE